MVGGRDRRRQLRWLWPRSGLQTTFDQAVRLSQTEASHGLLIFIAGCTSCFCLLVGISFILITRTQGCLCCAGQVRASICVGPWFKPSGPYCHIWEQNDSSSSATALRHVNMHGSTPPRWHGFISRSPFVRCLGYTPSNNELEGMCMEVVAAYFKHLPPGTDESYGLYAVPDFIYSRYSHKMTG